MKNNFSSDTNKTRCLARENIFPYTRWSQISRIGESLCLPKNLFCYREISSKNIIKTEWEIYVPSCILYFNPYELHKIKSDICVIYQLFLLFKMTRLLHTRADILLIVCITSPSNLCTSLLFGISHQFCYLLWYTSVQFIEETQHLIRTEWPIMLTQ